ncbi:hypothetical protein [Phenylobacterium sp.]|uniref:hypothetical protein n=1 Tax=Phenylobacterium sp. TaxID=1871053 RepID=UPI002610EF59|nr:hypothetical protein [Phenylobacterium sp.]
MTEDEAKTKWCPFVRIVNGKIEADNSSSHASVQDAYNRVVDEAKWAVPKGGCCIGSACMAFRWIGEKAGHSVEYHAKREPSSKAAESAHGRFHRENPLHGYCGLAGPVQ